MLEFSHLEAGNQLVLCWDLLAPWERSLASVLLVKEEGLCLDCEAGVRPARTWGHSWVLGVLRATGQA